jgi:ligand-binding sensor protein
MTHQIIKSHQHNIKNFVDINILQRIQDTFAKAMGVAAVTVDRSGTPITETSNFCRLCTMIRSTPAGLARCQWCDAEGGRKANQLRRPYAYLCAGGLLDAAAPIIIDGEYLGSILCGQVIPMDDQEAFRERIIERNIPLGLTCNEIDRAAREIVPVPRERFHAAVEMLSIVANYVIEMGAANLAKSKLLKEAQERAALKAALQEAQLRALKAQINPHFLFNSLTLLGFTALEEGAHRTEEIAYSLSDLLRYSLRNISTTVELGEEIKMIEQYLAIQKIGFGDRLEKRIEVDSDLLHFEVPCMVLQPLVENAVIHGAEPLTRTVTVVIRAYRQGGYVVLEVADDGVGMPMEIVEAINSLRFAKKNSLGLQNVIQRLIGEYGPEFSVQVEAFPDQGTTIRLMIPVHVSLPEESDVFADWPFISDVLSEVATGDEALQSSRINEAVHSVADMNLVDLVEVDHKSYESQEIQAEMIKS